MESTSVTTERAEPKDDSLHKGIHKSITEVVGETPSDPTTLV